MKETTTCVYIYIYTYIHTYIYIYIYIRVHAQTYSETPQLSVCQKRPGCFGDWRLELSIQCTSTAAAVEIRRHGWSFSRFFNGLRENLRGTPSILPSLMGLSCNFFPHFTNPLFFFADRNMKTCVQLTQLLKKCIL